MFSALFLKWAFKNGQGKHILIFSTGSEWSAEGALSCEDLYELLHSKAGVCGREFMKDKRFLRLQKKENNVVPTLQRALVQDSQGLWSLFYIYNAWSHTWSCITILLITKGTCLVIVDSHVQIMSAKSSTSLEFSSWFPCWRISKFSRSIHQG